jgi:hypothetical protein
MSAIRTARVHDRSIGSLLIVVILFTALVPAHYHLHHVHVADANAHEHEHAIDLHLITANVDQSHHDQTTSIFSATPDVIIKKGSFDIFPYLLLAISLVLLTLYQRTVRRSDENTSRHKQRCPYFSPPLRAPPAR